MRVNVCRFFLCIGFSLTPTLFCAAGNDPPVTQESRRAEIAAVRASVEAFVDAFNRRQPETIAALWSKNGEYVDNSGRSFHGRDAIAKSYADFFANHGGAQIHITIDSVRVLSDTAVIEEGHARLDPPPAGEPGVSRYTAVHVKENGVWKMASVREKWVAAPSTHSHVADLEWLIGDWRAEEHGVQYESTCRWIANKSFVERRYTATNASGGTTSGVQLIGWNPSAGHVQSWNFSADGGHAVGVWTPVDGGWKAEMRGVTGDGSPTYSVNTLKRLDDKAYVWQSTDRYADGISMPDTGEVILKRQ